MLDDKYSVRIIIYDRCTRSDKTFMMTAQLQFNEDTTQG